MYNVHGIAEIRAFLERMFCSSQIDNRLKVGAFSLFFCRYTVSSNNSFRRSTLTASRGQGQSSWDADIGAVCRRRCCHGDASLASLGEHSAQGSHLVTCPRARGTDVTRHLD
jgi:hypothetical protein